ncbi:MAG TPA: hypothetical protein VF746_27655 [Longimicrobium sp.]|jgi:hypothetical protein
MKAEASPPVPELDFSLLSTGLGILSTSPAWPAVEAALKRLEADSAAPDATGRKTDIALVQEYARKLEREADTIGRALVAGAAVGFAVKGERRVRIHRGLEAVSAGFELRLRSSADVAAGLKGLMQDVTAAYPDLKLSRGYSLRKPRTPADWLRLVRKDIEAVEAVPKTLDTAGAWADWSPRLLALFHERVVLPPGLRQLACEAARAGPGAWLRINPEEMTIREWSRLVQGGMGVNLPSTDPPPPAWAGAAALWALGLPALDPMGFRGPTRKVKKAAPDPAEGSTDAVARFVSGLPPRTPEVAAVIVADPGPQSHDVWLPAPRELAAVMVAPDDLPALTSLAPDFFPTLAAAAGTTYLVVEVGADGAESPALSRALRGPLASLPRVDLYPAPPRTTPRRHFVVAPASPGELLNGLRTQARAQAQANVQSQAPA